MLSRQEAKTNHQPHSLVTLSSPRRLLLRPLFLRRLPLHHHLLRPVLPERGHRQLPSDQRFLGRGILDVFCACPMVRLVPFGNRTDNMSTSVLRGSPFQPYHQTVTSFISVLRHWGGIGRAILAALDSSVLPP